MTSPDDKPTPEEQAAAEALARALDGEGGPEVPDDALQAAALLRFTAAGGELEPERRAAILDELLEDFGAREREPAAPTWRRWLLPLGGLAGAAAAAALVLVLGVPGGPRDEPAQVAAVLPAPSSALLAEQTAAARPGGGELGALRAEMRSYRGEMYAALTAHYGEEGVTR